jgi:glycosyltransferase involved in cell wall biosynthesis
VKIAILHYAAHPVVGGVENVVQEHARLLARAGHQVRIIAGRGAQVDPQIEFASLPLVDSQMPEILAMKSALDTGTVPAEFDALSNEIELQLRALTAGFDWLIAHNVCSLHKNLAATSALRRIADAASPRLILWHHDLAWTSARYRSELHEGDPWDLLRRDLPGAIQVTVSEARRRELADLIGIPKQRIRVIPNGIDPYEFLGIDAGTARLARDLDLPQADPFLLLPARVTPRKNIEMALRILGHMQSRSPRALLVVTGPVGAHNRDNQAYLESLISLSESLGVQDQVVFLTLRTGAPVSDDAMRQIFRLADALLFPSREEGFGIPILEAGLVGIPIFCSEIPALLELGGDHANFFGVGADPAAVAEQIQTVLSGDHVHRLRKRVLQEYQWDRIYSQHLAPLLEEPAA